MLTAKENNKLILDIQAKSTYIDHTWLDAGNDVLIVYTTKGWWLYKQGKWEEVAEDKARDLCDKYWFGFRFNEMKGA